MIVRCLSKYFARVLLTLCLALTAFGLQAQDVDKFTYSHLGLSEGLCSQRIYSICQTRDGALWWSSKKDVERYNGRSIRHYALTADGHYSNFAGRTLKLRVSAADSALYAFDNQGHLSRYDEARDMFFQMADIGAMIQGDVLLNDILVSEQGVWLAMREGIFFLHADKLLPVRRDVFTNTIIQTNHGLLFCTRNGVLGCPLSDAMPQADMALRKVLDGDVESGYYDAQYNKVWLGGFLRGLQILTHEADGSLTENELIGDAIRNPVRSICPFDDETMLVGIDGLGVYKATRCPTASGHYQRELLFDANEGKEGVLHGNGVYAVVHDTWDNIVVGSYSGGIDIARPVCSTPAVFQHTKGNGQSLQNDRVNCVAQFPDGVLVMGTDNGISLHYPTTRQWIHCCEGAVVLSLCLTPEGTMLASTYGKGVYEIRANGQSQLRYSKQNGILRDDHVYKVFYDHDKNLWMGCLDGDLVQQTAAGWRYYPIRNVQDIVQLPDGVVAVGTAAGVNLISDETGQQGELDYSNGADDVNRYVHTLYVNANKELWIGTDGGGVYIYNLQSHQTTQLTKANGLPSNVICSLTKDYKGRMMIATEEGLAFVNPEEPTRVICMNYGYGIEREYSARAVANILRNHLFYGTTTGALILNPEHLQELDYTAKLHVIGVTSAGEESCWQRHKGEGGETAPEQMIQVSEEGVLRLAYCQRTFDLYIESVNLRNHFDIVYQYKVVGGEWSKPTEQQIIRFTNMEPGTHHLRLRCISRTCGTLLDEVPVTIVVAQPWWNSWWMWVFYIGLVLLAFYGAWRIYQLHTKYMRLVVSDLPSPPEAVLPEVADHPHPEEPVRASESTKTEDGSEFIARVTKLVADNLSDPDFNIDRLCREMAMSRTLFYVKLKTYTGKSPQDFIRIIRLERASTLLRKGYSVTDTAQMAGFDNTKYFSTVFKKYFGVSPSKYG